MPPYRINDRYIVAQCAFDQALRAEQVTRARCLRVPEGLYGRGGPTLTLLRAWLEADGEVQRAVMRLQRLTDAPDMGLEELRRRAQHQDNA